MATKPKLVIFDSGSVKLGKNIDFIINNNKKISRNIWNIEILIDRVKNKIDKQFIFVVNDFSYKKESLIKLRKNNPNTIIIAYTKERNPINMFSSHRRDFFMACDKIALPYRENVCKFVSEKLNHPVYSLPYPYDIEAIKELFFKRWENRKNCILAWVNSRRNLNNPNETINFARNIASEFGLEVIILEKEVSWREWLELLSSCKYMINLDQSQEIGQVPIECAILKVCHIGSTLDAAKELWPKTSTNNLDLLLNYFKNQCFENDLTYAYQHVIQRHSFKSAEHKLLDLLNDKRKN